MQLEAWIWKQIKRGRRQLRIGEPPSMITGCVGATTSWVPCAVLVQHQECVTTRLPLLHSPHASPSWFIPFQGANPEETTTRWHALEHEVTPETGACVGLLHCRQTAQQGQEQAEIALLLSFSRCNFSRSGAINLRCSLPAQSYWLVSQLQHSTMRKRCLSFKVHATLAVGCPILALRAVWLSLGGLYHSLLHFVLQGKSWHRLWTSEGIPEGGVFHSVCEYFLAS